MREGRSVEKIGSVTPELRTQAPDRRRQPGAGAGPEVQRVAEDALGDHRGAVVAIDPGNGDIIALVSKPGFDPTEFARGITRSEYAALANDMDKPLLNRALRGTYPSGSTIKPAIGLVALTDHVITADRRCSAPAPSSCRTARTSFAPTRPNPRPCSTCREAIAQSSDVYFYKLASRWASTSSRRASRRSATGSSPASTSAARSLASCPRRPGSSTAFKHPADQVWFPGETVNLGVGQGYLLVTPLQLAHIVGVIAERGRSFRPRLVIGTARRRRPRDRRCRPSRRSRWRASRRKTGPRHQRHDRRTMTYCGTGSAAFAKAAYSAGGKTGTAQVYTVAQNESTTPRPWPRTCAITPGSSPSHPPRQPRIAVAVLVENAGFGGEQRRAHCAQGAGCLPAGTLTASSSPIRTLRRGSGPCSKPRHRPRRMRAPKRQPQ